MAGGKVENTVIAGIACAVPESVRTLEDEQRVFGETEAKRIAKNVGVYRRHVSTETICTSDLCCAAAEKLLDELAWDRNSIDLLVFVSVTPDYIAPATACILQHRLRLGKHCAAFDITHACTGYIYGLWTVAHLLSLGTIQRALLLVGDTVSRLVSPRDRSVAAIFGDAGSATAMEWNNNALPMFFELGTDGSGAQHLLVKAGAFRHPTTASTRLRKEREGGNVRSDEDLYMSGTEIFAFTLREVPSLKQKVLARAGWDIDNVDAVVMHQANLFIIQYLTKTMKIPQDKVIQDLADYGNTSAASIPMALTGKLAEQLKDRAQRLVLLGFGTGLSWGGVAMTCGPLIIPDITEIGPEDIEI